MTILTQTNDETGKRRGPVLLALGLFAGLYAAQAITGSLVQTGMPTVLRDGGVPLGTLGMLQLVFLPWALKFLWAPMVDRYAIARLGRRRSWLLACQGLIAGLFLAMAWISPVEHFTGTLVLLLAVAFFAATQDIATDALAVEAIPERDRGLIAGGSLAGGYLGFLLGVGAWLPLYAAYGWKVAMLAAAGAIVFLSVPAVMARPLERDRVVEAPSTRPGLRAAFANDAVRVGLLFLLIYQAGLRMGSALIGPYLVDAGYSVASVGWLRGVAGAVVGLLTAGLIIAFARRPGLKTLLGIAVFNALCFAALALVAAADLRSVLTPLILLQSAGMAAAEMTLYAVMIGWCSPKQAGTDFALLQSTDAVVAIVLGIAAGQIGQHLGHIFIFSVAAVLLGIAIVLAPRFFPTQATISDPQRS